MEILETSAPEKKDVRIYWIIGTFLFLAVAGFLVWFWYNAKAAGAASGAINLSSSTQPDGSAPSISTADVSTMAEKLHNDMSGVNLFGHNTQTWQDFLTLSDADVTRVYDQFDTTYQKDSGQSLQQWVSSETGGVLSGGGDWATMQPIVLARFAKLKLI